MRAAAQRLAAGKERRRTHDRKNLNVVGQSVPRRDGLGHVTGKTVYVDDISLSRHAPPEDGAQPGPARRIKGIDFSEAEKVPGFVRA